MTSFLARPLDRAEAFFWLLDRCSSMNFAVLAEGSGPLEVAAFEGALARAQAVHPALGVAIEPDAGGRLAFVPRPGARVSLTREAGGDDWREALARLLAHPFEAGDAPLVRAHWFDRPGGRWALALVFHHSIGDGRSGIRLLSALIDDARGSPAAPAPVGLRPSLMQSFPAELAGAAGLAKAQEWKAALRREPLRPGAAPGHAREAGAVRPAIVDLHFEAPVVEILARRAREHGTTLHGLIGAAELIAARRRYPHGEPPALMLTSPVDLRGRLVEPMNAATPGFYVSLLSSVRAVDGPEDLWPLAAFLAADLRRQVAGGCGHLFYHLVPPAESVPATAEGIAGFAAYMQRMPTAYVLSNVGRVEPLAEAGGVRVDEISFALCPMAHQQLFVAASTWDGRLTLNVVHDGARLEPAAGQALARGMELLLRGAAG